MATPTTYSVHYYVSYDFTNKKTKCIFSIKPSIQNVTNLRFNLVSVLPFCTRKCVRQHWRTRKFSLFIVYAWIIPISMLHTMWLTFTSSEKNFVSNNGHFPGRLTTSSLMIILIILSSWHLCLSAYLRAINVMKTQQSEHIQC